MDPKLEFEKLKFYGMIASTLERELGASIYDDPNDEFRTSLYQEYISQGQPKNPRAWIKKQIEKHFLCAAKRPVWIERLSKSRWPFFAGKPMMFIDQITVPNTEVAQGKLAVEAVLYVFGTRENLSGGGWRMVYQVVQQIPGI